MKNIVLIIISVLVMVSCGSQNGGKNGNAVEAGATLSESELMAKAEAFHKKYFTVDTHNDAALRIRNRDENGDPVNSQVTFPMMKEGGLDAAVFAIYMSQRERTEEAHKAVTQRTYDLLSDFKKYVEEYDGVSIAYSSEDLLRNKSNGNTSVILGIENGYAIGADIRNLEKFRDMGVICMTLCHNGHNEICDTSTDSIPEHGGLSDFGRKVVKEMNRLGMMVDISHASTKTLYDVLEVSEKPIFASHSSVWNIKNHNRNLKDHEMKALADKGGLIQVAIGGFFLSTEPRETMSVKNIADHIDYIKNLVGIEHVGLGTDYDGGGWAKDMQNASQMKNLTAELLRRGYTEKELELFWGGNFIRFMKSQNL